MGAFGFILKLLFLLDISEESVEKVLNSRFSSEKCNKILIFANKKKIKLNEKLQYTAEANFPARRLLQKFIFKDLSVEQLPSNFSIYDDHTMF